MRVIEIPNDTKHPNGLWVILLIAALLCYGFGTLNSLLVLYITSILGADPDRAYLLSVMYNSLLFIMPLAGGYLAEQFGYKRALLSGTVLCALALLLLSYESIHELYWSLALYTVGVGLFIPTYFVLIGKRYQKTDQRRESAFTLAYVVMNLGFLIASLFSHYLADHINYRWTFRFAAIITFLIIPLYAWKQKYIKPHTQRNMDPQIKWHDTHMWLVLGSTCFILTLIAGWLLEYTNMGNFILIALSVLTTVGIIYLAQKQRSKLAKRKFYALLILSYIAICFWSLYMLEPTLLITFIQNNVKQIFFHTPISSLIYYGLDPFFIIVIGIGFSFLWRYLLKRNTNPSLPVKFMSALFSVSIGFLAIVIGIVFANQQGYTSTGWIILAYLLFSIAELLISPIGASMMDSLTPEGMEGRMMGVWQLFTGASAVLSGYLAPFAFVPENLSREASNPFYMKAFERAGFTTLGIAVIALILIPSIKKLIKA